MITDVTWDGMLYVAEHLRADDLAEVMATRFDDIPRCFAADHALIPGPKYLALAKDGTPVALGGIAMHQPGVGQAWLVGTPRINECALEIARAGKAGIARFMDTPGCHRLQAFSVATHTVAHRWLASLGMRPESTLPKFGKRGEDFILFSILREV